MKSRHRRVKGFHDLPTLIRRASSDFIFALLDTSGSPDLRVLMGSVQLDTRPNPLQRMRYESSHTSEGAHAEIGDFVEISEEDEKTTMATYHLELILSAHQEPHLSARL